MLLECDPRFFLYDRRKIIGADCQFFPPQFPDSGFPDSDFLYILLPAVPVLTFRCFFPDLVNLCQKRL